MGPINDRAGRQEHASFEVLVIARVADSLGAHSDLWDAGPRWLLLLLLLPASAPDSACCAREFCTIVLTRMRTVFPVFSSHRLLLRYLLTVRDG